MTFMVFALVAFAQPDPVKNNQNSITAVVELAQQLAKPRPGDNQLLKLQKQRVDNLSEYFTASSAIEETGMIKAPEYSVLVITKAQLSYEYLEAILDIADTPQDKLKAYELTKSTMLNYEKLIQYRVESGTERKLLLNVVRDARLKIEIMGLKHKLERKPVAK
jgi:hypothetical protein